MIEFDVDMGYLLECDELDKVVLNDEDGEHEPMEFILKDAATVGERNPDGLPIGLTVSNDGNLLNWVGENYVRQDAATVGAGTCHIEVHDNLAETEGMGDVWLECDECHWQMPLEPSTPRFKYCPNCGREVVDK